MKYLLLFIFMFHFNTWAQDKEGDLQLPVVDVSEIERQEEEQIPTLDEVEMKQKQKDTKQIKTKQKSTEQKDQSLP